MTTQETAKRLLEKIFTNITPDIDFKKIETIEADIYRLENLEPVKEDKLYNTIKMTAKNLRILLNAARKNRMEFGTAVKRIETSTPPPRIKTKEPSATKALDAYEKELLEHDKFIKTATKPYAKSYGAILDLMRREIISLIRKLQ